jgi:hypothetical protein
LLDRIWKKGEEGGRGRGRRGKEEKEGRGEGLFCKQLITFRIYPVYIYTSSLVGHVAWNAVFTALVLGELYSSISANERERAGMEWANRMSDRLANVRV